LSLIISNNLPSLGLALVQSISEHVPKLEDMNSLTSRDHGICFSTARIVLAVCGCANVFRSSQIQIFWSLSWDPSAFSELEIDAVTEIVQYSNQIVMWVAGFWEGNSILSDDVVLGIYDSLLELFGDYRELLSLLLGILAGYILKLQDVDQKVFTANCRLLLNRLVIMLFFRPYFKKTTSTSTLN
jgi:hypothetical protein